MPKQISKILDNALPGAFCGIGMAAFVMGWIFILAAQGAQADHAPSDAISLCEKSAGCLAVFIFAAAIEILLIAERKKKT